MEARIYDDLVRSTIKSQNLTDRIEASGLDSMMNYGEMGSDLLEYALELYNEDKEALYQTIRRFSISEVVSVLQANHRFYLTKKLPEIEQSLLHIFSKYGQTHQLLTALAIFFNAYKEKLIEHIKMEEKEFFPYIKKLVSFSKGEFSDEERKAFLSNNSIDKFDEDHGPIEDELKEVSKIIQQYSNSKNTPLPYRIFLNQVELFELELRKHAIVEDHILVPLVKELEEKLRA
ncbi:MAG: hemerythrin [Spirosomaceae bacterium]|jgi:regulator of cell morphogenesis and NO signaling|nr:hemerythrin [Spirosomataceae bacterium]